MRRIELLSVPQLISTLTTIYFTSGWIKNTASLIIVLTDLFHIWGRHPKRRIFTGGKALRVLVTLHLNHCVWMGVCGELQENRKWTGVVICRAFSILLCWFTEFLSSQAGQTGPVKTPAWPLPAWQCLGSFGMGKYQWHLTWGCISAINTLDNVAHF